MLIRWPDDRHVLLDGGYNRAKQPSGKNAADFVDWKFFKDYEQSTIALDATKVKVKAFYHAGVSWWTDDGKRSLGPVDGEFLTRLLEAYTGRRMAFACDVAKG